MAHSPDGVWWWNGTTWIPAFSPDRAWWWDGSSWVPTAPPAPVRYSYEPTVWTNRIRLLIVALTVLGLVFALLLLPSLMAQVYQRTLDQSLAQPGVDPAEAAQLRSTMSAVFVGSFVFAGVLSLALYVVIGIGLWKMWRWIYWYFVVSGLLAVLAIPQDLAYAFGAGPIRLPIWFVLPGILIGAVYFALAIWMIVLYRRYGTWARRRIAVPPEESSGDPKLPGGAH